MVQVTAGMKEPAYLEAIPTCSNALSTTKTITSRTSIQTGKNKSTLWSWFEGNDASVESRRRPITESGVAHHIKKQVATS